MQGVLDGALNVVRELLKREAARIVAAASAGAVVAATFLASRAGVELSAEFVAGVAAFAAVVATEVIRQLVYSQATVEQIREDAHAEDAG